MYGIAILQVFFLQDLQDLALNLAHILQDWIKIGSSLVAKNIAGIGEGKESFTHCLIRLMCGTRDHLNEFPQSIVHNSRTGHRLS